MASYRERVPLGTFCIDHDDDDNDGDRNDDTRDKDDDIYMTKLQHGGGITKQPSNLTP
jgi:hypothetical protein